MRSSELGEKYLSTTVFVVVLAVYLGFLTKNFYWDGVSFALAIESTNSLDASLFHPSHLFYNVFGYIVYKTVGFLGFHPRALTVLQVCNAIFGALTAVVLYYLFRRIFRSTLIAMTLVFLFAFSATWWKFSTDANSYVPSIFFLITSFWFIMPGGKPRWLVVAMIHTLAMCFHQLAIFFFPVIIVGLYLQSGNDIRQRLRAVSKYAVVTGLLTFGIYYLCFYLQTGSVGVRDLMSWMTYYSTENGFVFNASESVSRTLSGTIKLFFGGRVSFLMENIDPLTLFLVFVDGLALLSFMVILVRGVIKRKQNGLGEIPTASLNQAVTLCLVWISAYSVFLFFWIPKNTFYRMFYLTPLIVLIGVWLTKSNFLHLHRALAPIFTIIVVLSNFLFLILPYAKVRRETPLYMAKQMNTVWTQKSVIYFSSMDSDNNLVRYFNPETNWKQLGDTADEEILDSMLRENTVNGSDIWIEHSAYDNLQRKGLATWLAAHSITETYKLTDPAYNMIFVRLTPIDQ